MSCSPSDLKDYLLNELADAGRRNLELHIKTCPACREELDRLRLTQAAMFSLREEEIPQRIAFVSDPVFEPSVWRRAWNVFWGSPARLGFASAAMLSAAILVSALIRPAAPSATARFQPASASIQTAAPVSNAEIERRIQAAVDKAVAASEQRETASIRQLVGELEQSRQQLRLAAAELDMSQRRAESVRYVSSNYGPPPQSVAGEQK
jgi:anti-sigma factor RsiW